jgi:hypothetical protein
MPSLRKERQREKRAQRRALREPKVLKTIGTESKRKGTSAISSRRIDGIIRKARNAKRKRQAPARRA